MSSTADARRDAPVQPALTTGDPAASHARVRAPRPWTASLQRPAAKILVAGGLTFAGWLLGAALSGGTASAADRPACPEAPVVSTVDHAAVDQAAKPFWHARHRKSHHETGAATCAPQPRTDSADARPADGLAAVAETTKDGSTAGAPDGTSSESSSTEEPTATSGSLSATAPAATAAESSSTGEAAATTPDSSPAEAPAETAGSASTTDSTGASEESSSAEEATTPAERSPTEEPAATAGSASATKLTATSAGRSPAATAGDASTAEPAATSAESSSVTETAAAEAPAATTGSASTTEPTATSEESSSAEEATTPAEEPAATMKATSSGSSSAEAPVATSSSGNLLGSLVGGTLKAVSGATTKDSAEAPAKATSSGGNLLGGLVGSVLEVVGGTLSTVTDALGAVTDTLSHTVLAPLTQPPAGHPGAPVLLPLDDILAPVFGGSSNSGGVTATVPVVTAVVTPVPATETVPAAVPTTTAAPQTYRVAVTHFVVRHAKPLAPVHEQPRDSGTHAIGGGGDSTPGLPGGTTAPSAPAPTAAPGHDGSGGARHAFAVHTDDVTTTQLKLIGTSRDHEVDGAGRDAALPTTSPD